MGSLESGLLYLGSQGEHPKEKQRNSETRPSKMTILSPGCLVSCLQPKCRPTLERILAPRNGSASLRDSRLYCLCNLPLPADSFCFWPLQGNWIWPLAKDQPQYQPLRLTHTLHGGDRVPCNMTSRQLGHFKVILCLGKQKQFISKSSSTHKEDHSKNKWKSVKRQD